MTHRQDRSRAIVRAVAARLAVALAVALAAGCASAPTTRLHSLVEPAPTSDGRTPTRVAPTLAWELASVGVPAQVDVPQLVIRLPDGSLRLLEHERWVAPLGDEVRAAVGQRLAQVSVPPATAITWQITIELRRFDAQLGVRTVLEADWTIRPAQGTGSRLRCHGVFEQPLPGGVSDIAAAHRATVARLADALAAGLTALASGGEAGCAAGAGA